MVTFTAAQRAHAVLWYETLRCPKLVERRFQWVYGTVEGPHRNQIRSWYQNFKATGSVFTSRKERDCAKSRVKDSVVRHFTNNGSDSLRKASLKLQVSRSTAHRTLQSNKFHPYKVQIVQKITDKDKELRMEFAETMLEILEIDPWKLGFIIFSDEAHFQLDGFVNKQNTRMWAQSNPNQTIEKPLHPERLTVWAGMSCFGLIGPVFIEGNINGASYLQLLKDHLWEHIKDLPGKFTQERALVQ